MQGVWKVDPARVTAKLAVKHRWAPIRYAASVGLFDGRIEYDGRMLRIASVSIPHGSSSASRSVIRGGRATRCPLGSRRSRSSSSHETCGRAAGSLVVAGVLTYGESQTEVELELRTTRAGDGLDLTLRAYASHRALGLAWLPARRTRRRPSSS
jgi:hypothetical protein